MREITEMREIREFVGQNPLNARGEESRCGGREPLPEPYESAARMVYGDRAQNEVFASRPVFSGGSLHGWRQRPEIIARVRFLSQAQRRRSESMGDPEMLRGR
jgi:hypothetical protein